MALLSATALVYAHGVNGHIWKEVWGIARPVDAVWGSALGTGLGAWFGAIPIPLDWYVLCSVAQTKFRVFDLHFQFRDRPWQAFPITILVGAYIGYALGSLMSRAPWLYGKRIQFAPVGTEEAQKKIN